MTLLQSDKLFAERGGMPRRRSRAARGGFTLIELIVSMTTGVIISGIAGSLLWNASRQQTEIAARGELIDLGGAALDLMLRYIREVPQDAALTGLAQISVAAQNQLTFGNFGFRHNSGSSILEMTIDGANWRTLAREVSGLTFTYFNTTAVELNAFGGSSPFSLGLADRQSIRRVRIDITLTRGTEAQTLRTGIFLRNFMSEVGNDP